MIAGRLGRLAAALLLGAGTLMTMTTSNGFAEEPTGAIDPKPSERAVVRLGNARFTMLTPALIRMEYAPTGKFEDRASHAFIDRNLPVPTLSVVRKNNNQVTISTDELTLRYKDDGQPFSAKNLRVEMKLNGKSVAWKPGMKDKGNLKGTYRTLDGVNGDTELEPGLISRDGWVVWDDSKRLLFDNSEYPWIAKREDGNALDWYFFGYGHDYKRALADFTKVAGQIPLPPRYVLGTWWSRYWSYTDKEFKDLVAQYKEHDVPLDVLVIDMGWHLVGSQYPKGGWTGYTWDPTCFPDPTGFMKWLKGEGLRTTLNLHPADGVGKHEAAFPQMAKAMGLDPATAKVVPFECTSRQYMDAYFKILHHPLETIGVDFWWMDWQQGMDSGVPGLDPLFWLNYLHWTDWERNPAKAGERPLIFSRWGGLGNHRYQIGFSGDTHCTWESLAFQPYFTSTAANVGYGWWSHDIGGHQPGVVDPELYARWIQFGAFSPILRTHTTSNPNAERRIWAFPDEIFQVSRDAFRLRYALIPYIYTAGRNAHDTAVSMCQPLYYEWPEIDEAYHNTHEYLFGHDLLVAPVTAPRNPVSLTTEVNLWIPPGEWTNWFTGETLKGPVKVTRHVPLNEIPLYVRSGAIIPAQPKMNRSNERPVDPLILHAFPGKEGSTRVYEDDGLSRGYLKDQFVWIPVSQKRDGKKTAVTVGPFEGSYEGMPAQRRYEVRFRDQWPAREVTIAGKKIARGKKGDAGDSWYYDRETLTNVISLAARKHSEKVEVVATSFGQDEVPLRAGIRGRLNMVDAVAKLLGDATPAELGRAVAVREDIELEAKEARESALRVEGEDWVAVIDAVSGAKADEAKVLQATSRLLGLSTAIAAKGGKGGSLDVKASIDLSEPVEGFDAKIELLDSPHWKIDGKREWKVGKLTAGKPVDVETRLLPADAKGIPQTTRLQGRMTLHRGNSEFVVPFEQTLLPSINAWDVCGPFDNPWEKLLNQDLPPETKIDLKAKYPGKDGRKAGWKKVVRKVKPGSDLSGEMFVDMAEEFGGQMDYAVAYAVTVLESPADMKAVLAVGSDDGVAVWVNGKEYHRNPAGRPYTSKQDRVNIDLKKGPNTVLLKISQGTAGWGFCAHVETADGKAIPELKVRRFGE